MEIWDDHQTIYHYTNQQGLEGILATQSLHATHYKCLNDRSEMLEILPVLKKSIQPRIAGFAKEFLAKQSDGRDLLEKYGGFDRLVEHEASTIVDVLQKVTFGPLPAGQYFNPYVISFCWHTGEFEFRNGLLSQWRGYGGAEGYALEFDTKELWATIDRDAMTNAYVMSSLGQVVYEGDQAEFEREFSELVSEVGEVLPRILRDKQPNLNSMFKPFMEGVARFKNAGFKEEREVRSVLVPLTQPWKEYLRQNDKENYKKVSGKKIKSINFKGGLVPYLVVGEEGRGLPIRRIIIGPHLRREVLRDRLQRFVAIRGLPIEVVCSEIPLS